MEHSQILSDYCQHRLSQLEKYRQILFFFKAESALSGYSLGLTAICRELEGQNADEDKRDNVHWLMRVFPECRLFFDDIHSILTTGKTVLPEDPLQIPAYYAELERQAEEAARKRREEEYQAYEARRVAREKEAAAKEKEERKQRVMQDLGLDENQLARILRK